MRWASPRSQPQRQLVFVLRIGVAQLIATSKEGFGRASGGRGAGRILRVIDRRGDRWSRGAGLVVHRYENLSGRANKLIHCSTYVHGPEASVWGLMPNGTPESASQSHSAKPLSDNRDGKFPEQPKADRFTYVFSGIIRSGKRSKEPSRQGRCADCPRGAMGDKKCTSVPRS